MVEKVGSQSTRLEGGEGALLFGAAVRWCCSGTACRGALAPCGQAGGRACSLLQGWRAACQLSVLAFINPVCSHPPFAHAAQVVHTISLHCRMHNQAVSEVMLPLVMKLSKGKELGKKLKSKARGSVLCRAR